MNVSSKFLSPSSYLMSCGEATVDVGDTAIKIVVVAKIFAGILSVLPGSIPGLVFSPTAGPSEKIPEILSP